MAHISVDKIDYHRNGVSGAPFLVALFAAEERRLVAVQFVDDQTCTAVFDVDMLADGIIEFGRNSWRGDYYAPAITDAGIEAGLLDRPLTKGNPPQAPAMPDEQTKTIALDCESTIEKIASLVTARLTSAIVNSERYREALGRLIASVDSLEGFMLYIADRHDNWAGEVDALMDTLEEVREIARGEQHE